MHVRKASTDPLLKLCWKELKNAGVQRQKQVAPGESADPHQEVEKKCW